MMSPSLRQKIRKSAHKITRSKTASERKAGSDDEDEDDRRHMMTYAI